MKLCLHGFRFIGPFHEGRILSSPYSCAHDVTFKKVVVEWPVPLFKVAMTTRSDFTMAWLRVWEMHFSSAFFTKCEELAQFEFEREAMP